jgi:hypothetical protein
LSKDENRTLGLFPRLLPRVRARAARGGAGGYDDLRRGYSSPDLHRRDPAAAGGIAAHGVSTPCARTTGAITVSCGIAASVRTAAALSAGAPIGPGRRRRFLSCRVLGRVPMRALALTAPSLTDGSGRPTCRQRQPSRRQCPGGPSCRHSPPPSPKPSGI